MISHLSPFSITSHQYALASVRTENPPLPLTGMLRDQLDE